MLHQFDLIVGPKKHDLYKIVLLSEQYLYQFPKVIVINLT